MTEQTHIWFVGVATSALLTIHWLFYLRKHTLVNLETFVEKGEYVLRRLWPYIRLDSFLFLFVSSSLFQLLRLM